MCLHVGCPREFRPPSSIAFISQIDAVTRVSSPTLGDGNMKGHAVPDYDKIWTTVYGDVQEYGSAQRHMRRILRHLLRSIEYHSVLDVGCGLGHELPMLCEGRQVRVAGLDISSWAIQRVRKTWGKDFYQMDIQEGHLNERWDLVYSSLLLEHLTDDFAALTNMRLMTKKYLLVATMAGDFERYKKWELQVGHVRNYCVGELEAKVERAGFTVRRVIYWGFPFFSPSGRILQNFMKVRSKFGIMTRLIAEIMYGLYFFNSHSRGDLIIILASVEN